MPRLLKIKFFLTIIILMASFIFAWSTFAQGNFGFEYATGLVLGTKDIRVTVFEVIRIIFGLLGIIALVIILYGGWVWMTSEGNEEKIEKAKRILKNAVIGLIIIFLAVAIVSFIIYSFTGNLGGNLLTQGQPSIGGYGGLGGGIIRDHYPARDQVDVPRNTKIVVTFWEEMDPATIIDNGNIIGDSIQIYLANDGYQAGNFVTEVVANTVDNYTFVFKPKSYLGSPYQHLWYYVRLTNKILKTDGLPAFSGAVPNYEWKFEVSTEIDLTPPYLEEVIPWADGLQDDYDISTDPPTRLNINDKIDQPRNVLIQMNFSEAVDPTAVSGQTIEGFDEIITYIKGGAKAGESCATSNDCASADCGYSCSLGGKSCLDNNDCEQNICDSATNTCTLTGNSCSAANPCGANSCSVTGSLVCQGDYIEGTYSLSNQYRTVEFKTDKWCGRNSCGGDVYCLPGSANVEVIVKAASLMTCDASGNQNCSNGLDFSKCYDSGYGTCVSSAGGCVCQSSDGVNFPQSLAYPYDGVVDMADNSLDGGGEEGVIRDGEAQGAPYLSPGIYSHPGIDDYWLSFWTSDEIDLTPPKIYGLSPAQDVSNINLDNPIEIKFDKLMSSSTLHSHNLIIDTSGDPVGWWIAKENGEYDDDEVDSGETKAIISHTGFGYNTDYYPLANSGLLDLYQNCYQPCSSISPACAGNPSCCEGAPNTGYNCPEF